MNSSFRFSFLLFLSLTSLSVAQPSLPEKPLEYASDSRLFSEGLAAVQLGAKWNFAEKSQTVSQDINSSNLIGKWGFMDKSGRLAINIQFDSANDFIHGLAPVRTEKGWGLIDKSGNFIVQPQYALLVAVKNGFISFANSPNFVRTSGYINEMGKIIFDPKYDGIKIVADDVFAVKVNNLWGLITSKDQWLSQPIYNFIDNFQNDLAVVGIKNFDTVKYGAINKSGKMIIEPIYASLVALPEGSFKYRNDNLFGILNDNGDIILKAKYTLIGVFNDGIASILENKKWGFIDIRGNIIVDPKYDSVGDFHDKRAIVGVRSGLFNIMHYGYIDQQGQTIIEPIYNTAKDFSEQLATVCKADFGPASCGYIDQNGTMVIKDEYSMAENFKNGFARVVLSSGFPKRYFPKYINKTGNIVLEGEPVKIVYLNQNLIAQTLAMNYSLRLGIPYSGTTPFTKSGKWGLMDQSGKTIVEPQYKSMSNFQDGLAKAITQDGQGVYINPQGNIVLP